MRLLHCRLQNIRLHGDLVLRFDPGLTVIAGPNEAGKSTLVEALHRTFFLKASATGAPVDALRSRLHPGHPTVEMGFEARGHRWTLRKRFSGSSGVVSLARQGEEPIMGPEAEEELARLLGVKEILGSRQAGSLLPCRWAHLWVMQGEAGRDPFERGPAGYDLDSLITQLEQGGGAALQSALDQQVANQIEVALAENYTRERGDVKRNSPLWLRQQAVQQAEAQLLVAVERLDAYTKASEDLSRLDDRLGQLQRHDLPALRREAKSLGERAAAVAELVAAEALRTRELEPDELRAGHLEASRIELEGLETAMALLQQEEARMHQDLQGTEGRMADLSGELADLQRQREQLDRHRQTIVQRGQLVARLAEKAHLETELARLRATLSLALAAASARESVAARLAELPAIDTAQVTQLREMEATLREERTRRQSLAAGVELLRADRPVWIDGEPLEPGQERRLSEIVELRVGDGVAMRLSPGGGHTLEECRAAEARAEQAFLAELQRMRVASVEEADQLARQREALQLQLQGGGAAPQVSEQAEPKGLSVQIEHTERELALLRVELAELSEGRGALEIQETLPGELTELEALHRDLQRSYRASQAEWQGLEKAITAVSERREAIRLAGTEAAQRLATIRADLRAKGDRRRIVLASHGSLEAMANAVAAITTRIDQSRREIAELTQRRAALSTSDSQARLARVEASIEELEEERRALIAEQAAARERCEGIRSGDPYTAVATAQVSLEQAEEDLRAIRRRVEAQRLLRELFQEVRADLSARYTAAMARAIDTYLEPLIGAGPACRLRYDQMGGFSGLELRRGPEFYGFDQLSGGMREQLTAALRLSIADVLSVGHGGCLPIVFDDAFTNTDPERVEAVKRMLAGAVERGLQVILLTCQSELYGDPRDPGVRLIRLGAPTSLPPATAGSGAGEAHKPIDGSSGSFIVSV